MINPVTPDYAALPPIIDNIPEAMRGGKWCVWKLVPKGGGKCDKIPYRVHPDSAGASGTASTNDPATFGAFEEAVAAYGSGTQFAGVGRLAQRGAGVWVDLDQCLTDEGLTEGARGIVEALDSYTEISPSGKGLRIFAFGELPSRDFTNNIAHVEMYEASARFLTVTGRVFEGRDQVTTPSVEAIAEVYHRYKTDAVRRDDTTPMPTLLESNQLPSLDRLGLDKKFVTWLREGFDGTDRSHDLQVTTKGLYACGLDDDVVFSLLVHSAGAWAVADSHRRTEGAAEVYLWQHHCLDARHCDPRKGFKPIGDGGNALGEFLERYVFIRNGSRVHDLRRPIAAATTSLADFQNDTSNIQAVLPTPTKANPDRVKHMPMHALWLADENRKSVDDLGFAPEKSGERLYTDEDGVKRVNVFHLPRHADTGASLGVFHHHMDYLFPHPDERTWFIDWMAFNVQRPAQRCMVTPLHVSVDFGTGRGWVVKLLQSLLGHWNCSKTKMDALCGEGSAGQYNDYLHQSLLCFIDETKESGGKRWEVADRVRDTLTEDTLPINIKFGAKGVERVYTNFFMMSNHHDALVLPVGDRRVQVLSGPDEVRKAEYYDALYTWLDEGGGVGALHHWLKRRDISGFNWKRSTGTAGRVKMMESNRSETEELFWQVMENPPPAGLMRKQFIQAMLEVSEKTAFHTNINEKELAKLLRQHTVGERVMKIKTGRPCRVWVLDKALRESTRENNARLRDAVLDYGGWE